MTEPVLRKMAMDLFHDGGARFLRLESVDAGKNRFRFYTFTCQQTLWDEWAICCTWGRIGTLGRVRSIYAGSPPGLIRTLEERLADRLGRGYVLASHASHGSSAPGQSA